MRAIRGHKRGHQGQVHLIRLTIFPSAVKSHRLMGLLHIISEYFILPFKKTPHHLSMIHSQDQQKT